MSREDEYHRRGVIDCVGNLAGILEHGSYIARCDPAADSLLFKKTTDRFCRLPVLRRMTDENPFRIHDQICNRRSWVTVISVLQFFKHLVYVMGEVVNL